MLSVKNSVVHANRRSLDEFAAFVFSDQGWCFFSFVLSNANKQIWPIRPLHFSTNVLVAQNAHQSWMYKSKIILFYPRHTEGLCYSCGWILLSLHISSVTSVLLWSLCSCSGTDLLGHNLYSVLKDTRHTSNTAKGSHATPGLKWAFYNFVF